jgi:hypothetical protein
MGAATEEAVGGVAIAVQVEASELKICGTGREVAVAHLEHGGSVRGTGPDKGDWTVAIALVDDPGRRRAALGRVERGAEVVGAGKETNDGARISSRGSAGEGFGGRRVHPGISVITRRRGKNRAIRGGRFVIQAGGAGETLQDIYQQQEESDYAQARPENIPSTRSLFKQMITT